MTPRARAGARARQGPTGDHDQDGTHVPTDRKDFPWRVDS